MVRIRRQYILLLAAILLAVAAGFLAWPSLTCVQLAMTEYLKPTTIEVIPLPEGCNETSEEAPERLMEIVKAQQTVYHLTLQNVVVCRTPQRLPTSGPSFTQKAFDVQVQKRWIPAYVGCCTYIFRRHFAVVVPDNGATGAVVIVASLVESRWDYIKFLRWHCDEQLRSWL
jgi:hypothetical protein